MRRAIVLCIVVLFFISCGNNNSRQEVDEKKVITVSILPLKSFVEQIGGDDFEINVLLPPGASPANFSLVPSQLKDIARSQIWFRVGHIGFELSWRDKILQVNEEMKEVDLSEGLDLIHAESVTGEQGTSGGINPHTWLSSSLVKQMVEEIAAELSQLNPERKSYYDENLKAFVEEVGQLDAEINEALKDYEGRQFISFHPSLSYFAREYGLIQHSLEPGGKEPTPQRMAKLIDLARKENIDVIYIQSDFDLEQARVFAEEIDGQIEQMWPLNPDWFNNLRGITKQLITHFED